MRVLTLSLCFSTHSQSLRTLTILSLAKPSHSLAGSLLPQGRISWTRDRESHPSNILVVITSFQRFQLSKSYVQ